METSMNRFINIQYILCPTEGMPLWEAWGYMEREENGLVLSCAIELEHTVPVNRITSKHVCVYLCVCADRNSLWAQRSP